jgi:hypothetical protein
MRRSYGFDRLAQILVVSSLCHVWLHLGLHAIARPTDS